ncbi:MAG: DUF4153 domain-containing protein [Bacteroidia bacterium]|nr:DUF4153 domain-containing protein [Bacteroidia bacterium]
MKFKLLYFQIKTIAMQIPSLNYILKSISETLMRFPLSCLSAVVGSFSAIILIIDIGDENFWQKTLMCSALGLIAYFIVHLYTEYYKLINSRKNIIIFFTTILLVLYFLSLGDKHTEIEIINFFVLNLLLHLVASYVLFIRNNTIDDFWNFNKNLFVRFLTSSLYSAVLFVGLSFALIAIDNLFNIDINYKIYSQLYILIVGVFNTFFFLNGVTKPSQIKDELIYPKGLKNFTQFVLIPLVVIYLTILLAYELKIILTFDLPIGWVSSLVLVFFVLGILSILLVYPLRNSEDNSWIKKFSKLFFILVLPLLILLFWAIGYRIQAYGVTVERYYVFILACWVALIAIYGIIKPNYHIKIIPISLSIVLIISLFGPQSANGIAKYSQSKRLINLLQINQVKALSIDERKEITSITHYLYDNYEVSTLKETFPKAFKNDSNDLKLTVSEILKSENINYTDRYQNDVDYGEYFDMHLDNDLLYLNKGFDLMWMYDIGSNDNGVKQTIKLNNNNQVRKISVNRNELMIAITINYDTILLDWKPLLINNIRRDNKNQYPLSELSLVGESRHYTINMVAQNIEGAHWKSNDSLNVSEFKGAFYLKLK